eukprot:5146935-Pleurochrysis_carterae.AAC.1
MLRWPTQVPILPPVLIMNSERVMSPNLLVGRVQLTPQLPLYLQHLRDVACPNIPRLSGLFMPEMSA